MSHHHLSLYEREQLAVLKAKGLSFREIGKVLKRSHVTLSREYRNKAKYGRPYIPCKAHEKARRVAISQRTKAPLKNKAIFLYVRHKLRDLNWSPEIIAGRLPLDYPGESIHFETIYRYVYNHKKTWGMKLWRYLARHRKRRLKKDGRKVKPVKYLRALPLVERPVEANNRQTIGHWETDNLGGKVSDQRTVSGTAERKSRYTHLALLKDKTSVTKMRRVKSKLSKLPPQFRQTLTIDNGPENAKHQLLKATFQNGIYSCQPYHSWEKGTVENMFGRVRRFIPKGTSLDTVDRRTIRTIEHWLNHTPRKCLSYRTPYEIMQQELKVINNQGGAFQVRM
ncbi:MAG: IS30 family transposase [Patescibacteria group bacterium]|nr:IS30 family transposase [Patescibacteria group bacterium]